MSLTKHSTVFSSQITIVFHVRTGLWNQPGPVCFYIFLVLTPITHAFHSPSLYFYLHYLLPWPGFSLNPLWNESVCPFWHAVKRTDVRNWMRTLSLECPYCYFSWSYIWGSVKFGVIPYTYVSKHAKAKFRGMHVSWRWLSTEPEMLTSIYLLSFRFDRNPEKTVTLTTSLFFHVKEVRGGFSRVSLATAQNHGTWDPALPIPHTVRPPPWDLRRGWAQPPGPLSKLTAGWRGRACVLNTPQGGSTPCPSRLPAPT